MNLMWYLIAADLVLVGYGVYLRRFGPARIRRADR